MKHSFTSLGRLAVISSIAVVTATISNFFSYQKYWNGTIFAVQTVDFNILSHTLPTKLSIVLNQGNQEEIQRTLNSNYGLFGIVVTDCKSATSECSEQKILYFSQPTYRWQQQNKYTSLSKHPYDILRDPPPIHTEGRFAFTRDRQRQPTGRANSGTVIGRVYYVRNQPPSFAQDYKRWLSNPLTTTGANITYSLTTALFALGGLFTWRSLERVLYQKRLQQELARQERQQILEKQEQLLTQARSVQQELQEKIQQTQVLLVRRERDQAQLVHYQAWKAQQVQQLEQTIVQYETQLAKTESRQNLDAQSLEQLQQELVIFQQREVAAMTEIEEHEQKLAIVQQQFVIQSEEKQQKVKLLEQLRQELQDTKEKELTAHHQTQMLRVAIATLSKERDQTLQQFHELEEHLLNAPNINDLITAIETARNELAQAKQFEEYAIEENQQLRSEKERLSYECDEAQIQNWDLKEQVIHLEEQLKYYLKYFAEYTNQHNKETLAVSYYCETEETGQPTELSKIYLALVGGHPSVRREVICELSTQCGLRNYVEVAPSSEAQIGRSIVKAKISNCNLVVVITGYIGHDLSGIIRELQEDEALGGQVLWVNCRGKSGIVREIIQYIKHNSTPKIIVSIR